MWDVTHTHTTHTQSISNQSGVSQFHKFNFTIMWTVLNIPDNLISFVLFLWFLMVLFFVCMISISIFVCSHSILLTQWHKIKKFDGLGKVLLYVLSSFSHQFLLFKPRCSINYVLNGKFSTWNFALTPITILQGIEMHLSSGAEKVSNLKNMFTFFLI